MLRKILVPLDGSEIGELALVYAKELASAIDLEVQMACATESRDKQAVWSCSLYLEKVAERLSTQIKRINPKSEVNTVTVDGEPAEALIDYTQKKGIDLVIMMSHGRSGIMPWAMGSTANKIIQKSKVPVLMIRAEQAVSRQRPVQVFKNILIPLDGSALGEAALDLTKTIAHAMKSKVILLFVVETVEYVHSIGGPDHFVYSEMQVEKMKKDATQYLGKVQEQFDGGNVQLMLRTGEPAREIIRLSDEEKVSIVAMSSHGKTGITRWMMGSTSSKILHAGKTPLLLVRPQQVQE
jgi:nucleotide-binding universal stress UspA family protein